MNIQSKSGIKHRSSSWGGEQFLIIPNHVYNTLGGASGLLQIYTSVFGEDGCDVDDDPDSTFVGGWIGPDHQNPNHIALGLAKFADDTLIRLLVDKIEERCLESLDDKIIQHIQEEGQTEDDQALKIRTRSFLGSIAIGAVLGFTLLEASFRGAIIGAAIGGIFVGSIGEAVVGGNKSDCVGSSFVLGFIAGILIAIVTRPIAIYSCAFPFVSGGFGIILGLLGHVIGHTGTKWLSD